MERQRANLKRAEKLSGTLYIALIECTSERAPFNFDLIPRVTNEKLRPAARPGNTPELPGEITSNYI